MADIRFFDVKKRVLVSIDSARVWKYIWIPTTKPNVARYAVCGKTPDGRTLTKFVNPVDWDALDVPMSDPEIEADGSQETITDKSTEIEAIKTRVANVYEGEPVGRVVADVMFLLLAVIELLAELEPFAVAFAEVPEGLRSTLRMWDGENGELRLSATTDHMKRAAEVVARYKIENSPRGEN